MDTEKPAIVSEPGAEIIPDAAMPGIYQDIIKALINRSDDLADLAKAQIRVTDALLEERQLARDTAHSVAAIAAKVTGAQPGLYATKKDIDRIAVSLDKMAVSTEAAQVFFAQRIAALEGAQSVDVAEALDNVLMDAEEARKKSRKIASHS